MELKDLLTAPNKDLTDEELERKINIMRTLRAVTAAPTKSTTSGGAKRKTVKSNADRQVADLLKNLSPDELQALLAKLGA